MEQQKQVPSTMKVEIGGVEYTYELKEKSKYKFEVGDIVYCEKSDGSGSFIRLITNIDKSNNSDVMFYITYELEIPNSPVDMSRFKKNGPSVIVTEPHKKATPEQEALFKRKCLENDAWFDQENKKWIDLEVGKVYIGNFDNANATFIFSKQGAGIINSYVILHEEGVNFEKGKFTSVFPCVRNISEATQEEKQKLFNTLKEKGKQWNDKKKCVEDLKWVPKLGEVYWSINTVYEPIMISNGMCSGDVKRINNENYFKTQEECEKYAEYMKECSLKYKQ